jgi:hypothetical protein
MPLFVCENCGVIENTALGHYWSRKAVKVSKLELQGKALCSECCPETFIDGSPTGKGKWHDKFPKDYWSETNKTPVINK